MNKNATNDLIEKINIPIDGQKDCGIVIVQLSVFPITFLMMTTLKVWCELPISLIIIAGKHLRRSNTGSKKRSYCMIPGNYLLLIIPN